MADPERSARVAGTAVGLARLRHVPNQDKKVAIVLSSYPTKHARVGNAVGLDTPASAVILLRRMLEQGYDTRRPRRVHTGRRHADPPADRGRRARRGLADRGADVRPRPSRSVRHLPDLVRRAAASFRDGVVEHGGEAPGQLYVTDDEIYVASLRFGNVMLLIQPPRGFGENPVAIYHDPNLPPSHQYLAAYRWLEKEFGAHAVLHLGKHGTLEWLRARDWAWPATARRNAVLGGLPMIYPFIVNDPARARQAKRRAHATVVDHMIPPMARADTYGDMAKLEQLLDEYATVQALDPSKLATVRGQIWELVTSAKLHHDLHTRPRSPAGGLRRLRHAHRRLPVRDQGRADPGRPAHPRPRAGG
ncbi:cobaltochelatase subunit CobN [Kutzneria kofuensis]|uniref:cobaltochelatase subunit CobN n=1 Tax=Kutzneria kofuensis TaxID=103725 RepID=UPI0031ECD9E7